MNLTGLNLHTGWLIITGSLIAVAVNMAAYAGLAKPAQAISWLDVCGEGSIVMLTLLWLVAILASRPAGQVTHLLNAGLNCFLFTALLDLLDEFFMYSQAPWISMVESLPGALGMVIMSVALLGWHREQLALNRQLQGVEWFYRSHQKIDPITQLYRGDYWRARVQECQRQQPVVGVLLLDLNNFRLINQRYGQAEGDRFLKEIGQLIRMHLRPHDLACRYAGDRFAVLLPQMSEGDLANLCCQLEASVQQVAFKTGQQTTAIFHSARTAKALLTPDQPLDALLCSLNAQLDGNAHQAAG